MKIVVGCKPDSAVSRNAVNQAIDYAKVFGGSIHLLTSMIVTSEDQVPQIEGAEEELKKIKVLIEKEGVPAEIHFLVRGMSPGEDIVKFAKEESMDLAVIGIEKKSKVGKLVFGSNAQFVILEAPCPVLAVK